MSLVSKKKCKDFTLCIESIDNNQIFLILSVTNMEKEPQDICRSMYTEIAAILTDYHATIFHERVFGSVTLYEDISKIRNKAYGLVEQEIPFTLVEGNPYWGRGIAGISIHGVIIKNESEKVRNIKYENKVCGRIWETTDEQYIILHSIHGLNGESDSYIQSLEMFERANLILKDNGFEFKNVIRTWIYLNRILEQYDDFNKARNLKFKEFNLITEDFDDASYEQTYMPASTGIDCNNPFSAAGVMDVFAVKKAQNSCLNIHNETGKKQKSAFRYGSAFSRAMVIEDSKSKYIYLSGTASINDKGETVFIGNPEKQIEMAFSVTDALADSEKFGICNICEGTVFLKKAEYIKDFQKYIEKCGFMDLPLIVTVANVCRDDLLFEMDATLIGTNNFQ